MKLSRKMILSFLSLIIISIIVISSISNIMINRSFGNYLDKERIDNFNRIYEEINNLYMGNDYKLDSTELKHLAQSHNITITIENMDGTVEYSSIDTPMANMHGKNHNHQNNRMQNKDIRNNKNFTEEPYILYKEGDPIGKLLIGYVDTTFFTDSANLFKSALFRSFIISGIITIIIGLLISIFLSKRLTRPLTTIKETATEIEKGNLNARSNISTDIHEIIELSNSIDFLGKALKDQEEIRKRYAMDISHELRTPLTTLQAHLEAIIDGVWEPTPEHLSILMSETNRLKSLIEDLKDSFTQEDYEIDLDRSNFNMSKLIKDTILTFLPIYNKKDYNIKYEIENDINVFMDKDKIKQIINNLLTNSLAYLKENGEVFIKLARSHENLILIIEDNGKGIDEKNLPFIFDRFFRIDSSRNEKTGGRGLGLSIVNSIVKAHNGDIKVESIKNSFTRFTITFKL